MTEALTSIASVLTSCTTIITGNDILMTMFVAGLVGVGFRLFKRARKAVN